MTQLRLIQLEINDDAHDVPVGPYDSLNTVLRDRLGMTGTKRGCDTGGCGTCTVLVDGQAVYSCMYPASRAEGASVRTIEGVGGPDGLHPLQESLIASGGIQCGYCTPGIVMASLAIYGDNPQAGPEELGEELAGNLCRCTGYVKVIEGLTAAGLKMRNGND